MIDSKQRAKLRGLASKLQPVAQIGLEGISDNLIGTLNGVLETRELIKVKILQNSSLSAKMVIEELSSKLKAEPVVAIGKVVVLFRVSKKQNIKHIEI